MNCIPCLACKSDKSGCRACIDVCPVNAIEIEDGTIDVLDSCRKCGLCVASCPTEAFVSPRLQPKKVYDAVARAATAHETAYVTCTRALKRVPRENEVVLACVGDVTRETWFSILTDFPNVSVYLPLDICTACRNAAGEEMLGEAIATAEWAGRGMGLEVEPKDLVCNKRREYERKEFVDNIVRQTGLTVSKLTPATAAVATVTQRIREHSSRVSALEKTLNTACGTTSQKRRRVLTQGRQLMLSTLQQHPELAENVRVQMPECYHDKCTMCGDCVAACPVFACDLLASGKLAIEPTYCIGCGLCAKVCGDHALTMVERDGAELRRCQCRGRAQGEARCGGQGRVRRGQGPGQEDRGQGPRQCGEVRGVSGAEIIRTTPRFWLDLEATYQLKMLESREMPEVRALA